MSLLKWIHLSDIHIRSADKGLEKYNSNVVLQALWRDIDARREIAPDLAQLDFAFITGDLAWSGADGAGSNEYEEVYSRLIEPLCTHANIDIGKVFVVPGNHDIARSALTEDVQKAEASLSDRDSISKLFVESAQQHTRGALFARLTEYSRFAAKHLPHMPLDDVFTFSKMVTHPGLDRPIRIVGLNSAWLSRGGSEDRKKIALGEPPVRGLLQSDTQPSPLTIVLVHHPLSEASEWYRECERGTLDVIRSAADFLLAGHVHDPNVISQFALQGPCVNIVAGSIYENRQWSSNSYNYVCYDTEQARGNVFLRRYCDSARPGPEWQDDLLSTGGKAKGVVRVHLARSAGTDESIKIHLADAEKSLRVRSFVAEQKRELNQRPLLSQSHPDRDSVAVLFPNVYVDPLVSPLRNPTGRPIALSDWMETTWREDQKILLIGGAGTGKTTALISMQHQMADACLTGASSYAPVFVDAPSLDWSSPPSVMDIAKLAISNRKEHRVALTPTVLSHANPLVMIDAIDEAFPNAYQDMKVFDSRQAILDYPHLVSCRDDFFRRNLKDPTYCSQYDEILQLQPWTVHREVDMFLRNYWKERYSDAEQHKRDELQHIIQEFTGASGVDLTPLAVTTLLFLWRYDYTSLVQNPPTTLASLIRRLTQIWAEREVAKPGCVFGTADSLLRAYEETAWLQYSHRGGQRPSLHRVARAISKATRLPAPEVAQDRGLLSMLKLGRNDPVDKTPEVVSFLHQAIYEYLLANRLTQALRGHAPARVAGHLLGQSVNRLARQLLTSLSIGEQQSLVDHLRREYLSLHRAAFGWTSKFRWVLLTLLRGRSRAHDIVDENALRRLNLCYFWGRLESSIGGNRMRKLFGDILTGKIVEHEVIVNTIGSGVLLVDDAQLEAAYLDRLSDNGVLDQCNRTYHRVYYGDMGYTTFDSLLRDEFVYGRDDWLKTRDSILGRLASTAMRDTTLRSLDLVTFRRLCETRGLPALIPNEQDTIARAAALDGRLSEARQAIVATQHAKLLQLLNIKQA